MKKLTTKAVSNWLENLGYSYNQNLYKDISKISYSYPSYKVMADTVLRAVNNNSVLIDEIEAWRCTTNFVNGMKSGLIKNNKYFQNVMRNGLFNPKTKKNDENIKLFSTIDHSKNRFNYLRNIRISNGKETRSFDFVLIINGFPLILIETMDGKGESYFDKGFEKLEESFNKFPMFFNFNKLILLTDGEKYKMGTLLNFPEEFIEFRNLEKDRVSSNEFSILELEKLLSTKNVIEFLKVNSSCEEISNYLRSKTFSKTKSKINEDNKKEANEDDNLENERKDKIDKDIDEADYWDDLKELSLILDGFNPDLGEVLASDEFKEKLNLAREVPSFEHNRSYVEEIQSESTNIRKKDQALDTFVRANQRLVMKEANKFYHYQTSSMDIEDMYQLGFIGLLKASDKFDLSMDNEFSTYATFWIRQSIQRGIQNDSLAIRVPAHNWEKILKLRRLEYESYIFFDRVDYDWIARQMELDKEKLLELVRIKNTFLSMPSLDMPVGESEDTALSEFIVDVDFEPEDIILNKDLRKRLMSSMNILDDRSKDILIRRFGLNGEDPMTLEEIGDIYDITRERVRQLINKALEKLSKPYNARKFIDYCKEG